MKIVSALFFSIILLGCSTNSREEITQMGLRDGQYSTNKRKLYLPDKDISAPSLPPAPSYVPVWVHEKVLEDGTYFQGGDAFVPYIKNRWQ